MPASEETWAEVKRACCETMEPLPEISARSGIVRIVITAKAVRENWRRPDGSGFAKLNKDVTKAAASNVPHEARPRSSAVRRTGRHVPGRGGTAQQARDTLIRRMYAAIGLKLTHLEERMEQHIADGKPLTQEESERETRELTQMIQGFEKVTEVATDAAKSDASRRPAAAITSPADIERVRRELAERLHRAWGSKDP